MQLPCEIPLSDLRLTQRPYGKHYIVSLSDLYLPCALGIIFISGLPAFLAYLLFMSLGLATAFHVTASAGSLLLLFYLVSLGASLTPICFLIAVYLGFALVNQPISISLDERGVSYDLSSKYAGLLLRLMKTLGLKLEEKPYIKWEDIAKMTYSKYLPFTIVKSRQLQTTEEFICFKLRNDSLLPFRRLCISDFNQAEKERLMYFFRTYCPEVLIEEEVRYALVGTTTLPDCTYTKLWLDSWNSDARRKRTELLAIDDELQGGSYKIIKFLGSGGKANIYLASCHPTSTQPDWQAREFILESLPICTESTAEVVLKEYVVPMSDNKHAKAQSLASFENEIKMLSKLSHPGIVKLFDVFVEDQRVYLVLEKVDGISLKDLVDKEGPIVQERVIKIALAMCDVLVYLHNLIPPVVHRDFTPDNLLLGNTGSVKLVDFNVAQEGYRHTQDVVGKPPYMSPEQFKGKAESQSDIYSLACILYLLLTGLEPIPISQSHPIEKAPSISPSLDAIVAKGTAINLEDRYKTIQEMKEDLERVALELKMQVV